MIRGKSVDMCCWHAGGEDVNTVAVVNIRPTRTDMDRARVRAELETVEGTPEGNTLEENEGI